MINESEGDKAKTTTRGLLSVKPKGIIVIIIYKLEYALKYKIKLFQCDYSIIHRKNYSGSVVKTKI